MTITARQPQGIPAGGQFAATAHAEPGVSLAPTPDRSVSPAPASQYELTQNSDGTYTHTSEAGTTVLEHRTPTTRSEIRRALTCPRSAGRIVDLEPSTSRRGSVLDDDYDVVGPSSGAPLVIRVQNGFHRLRVQSGRVDIEVRQSFGGGVTVGDGASANVVVEGDTKYYVDTEGSADTVVIMGRKSRVSVNANGTGTGRTTLVGGGPECSLQHNGGRLTRMSSPESAPSAHQSTKETV